MKYITIGKIEELKKFGQVVYIYKRKKLVSVGGRIKYKLKEDKK